MKRAGLALVAVLLGACVRVHTKPAPLAPSPLLGKTITFDFESLDDRPVSTVAFHGKPAVLVFVAADALGAQVEVEILGNLAKKEPDRARYAFIAVEPRSRREFVQGFEQFFEEKMGIRLLGAICDDDSLAGNGPFGDVRDLTVAVLDSQGRLVFRNVGVTTGVEIAHALAQSAAPW